MLHAKHKMILKLEIPREERHDRPLPTSVIDMNQLTPLQKVLAQRGQRAIHHRISSHAPLGGERPHGRVVALLHVDISTHAPLAGSDAGGRGRPAHGRISTHAPLAGSDLKRGRLAAGFLISTHAPLAGSDHVVDVH